MIWERKFYRVCITSNKELVRKSFIWYFFVNYSSVLAELHSNEQAFAHGTIDHDLLPCRDSPRKRWVGLVRVDCLWKPAYPISEWNLRWHDTHFDTWSQAASNRMYLSFKKLRSKTSPSLTAGGLKKNNISFAYGQFPKSQYTNHQMMKKKMENCIIAFVWETISIWFEELGAGRGFN